MERSGRMIRMVMINICKQYFIILAKFMLLRFPCMVKQNAPSWNKCLKSYPFMELKCTEERFYLVHVVRDNI